MFSRLVDGQNGRVANVGVDARGVEKLLRALRNFAQAAAQDKKRDTVLGDDGLDSASVDRQDKVSDLEVVTH